MRGVVEQAQAEQARLRRRAPEASFARRTAQAETGEERKLSELAKDEQQYGQSTTVTPGKKDEVLATMMPAV